MAFSIFSLPASSIVLILSAAFGVSNALPWAGPTPTLGYTGEEWSPRPTNSPLGLQELFKRDTPDIAVCGWLGGKSDNPAVCPTGSSCIHDMSHGYVGCCTTSGACTAGVYTSCVDKNSKGGISSGPLVVNNGIFTWYICHSSMSRGKITNVSEVLAIKNATKTLIPVDTFNLVVGNRVRLRM